MTSGGHLKTLTSIVAFDRAGAIGARNALPWRLKSDMSFFKETTHGNTVIMGRKTYDSIGKCLQNRANLVLSHNFKLFVSTQTCRVALSLAEALHHAECNKTSEIFVIGGAMTYEQFAPYVDRYLVTEVDHIVPDADAYISESILGDIGNWNRSDVREFQAEAGKDQFSFSMYEVRADDTDERRELRRELFRQYSEQIRTKPGRSSYRRTSSSGAKQLSLI